MASSAPNKLATATRYKPPTDLANHEPTTQKTGADELLSLPRFDPGHHEGEAAHEGPPQTSRVKPQIGLRAGQWQPAGQRGQSAEHAACSKANSTRTELIPRPDQPAEHVLPSCWLNPKTNLDSPSLFADFLFIQFPFRGSFQVHFSSRDHDM